MHERYSYYRNIAYISVIFGGYVLIWYSRGDGCSDAVLWKIRKIGVLDQLILGLIQMQIKECGSTFGEKYERDI